MADGLERAPLCQERLASRDRIPRLELVKVHAAGNESYEPKAKTVILKVAVV